MKATFLKTLIVTFAAATLISCTDDLESLVVPPSIVGVWGLESVEYDVRTEGVNNGEVFTISHTGMAEIFGLKMNMTDDPTNTFLAEGYYTVEIPADFEGTTFKEVFPFSDVHKRGTWFKESDGVMHFYFEGLSVIEAEIQKFSEKKLVISYDVTIEDKIDGVTCTNKIHGLYTFSKE
ncbi:hypothetical protein FKX85_13580 [Echinicola soli]|uniref:Lipocalin-like domain-containing protein n=1 Tax=Echinicola soli TaxID=2591634 RepID=A0A514CJQ5_9BACT|nr:hypothetical protein [Echinicola soli]QDH80006.1 hypothetical protein FKX85_13580 [Echinicola soli]